jgi:transcriptional regulator with XRE-family HTH domain
MTATTPYDTVLARNIRAARTRKGLGQTAVVERMRALGHTAWHRQTMGNVERGDRRVTAEEIFALSEALETSIGALMAPIADDDSVSFPSGGTMTVDHVRRSVFLGRNDGEVKWSGNDPVLPGPPLTASDARTYVDELDPDARAHFEGIRSLLPDEPGQARDGAL